MAIVHRVLLVFTPALPKVVFSKSVWYFFLIQAALVFSVAGQVFLFACSGTW